LTQTVRRVAPHHRDRIVTTNYCHPTGTGHGMHVGNPTCKEKTLDVGKSVNLAQADDQ